MLRDNANKAKYSLKKLVSIVMLICMLAVIVLPSQTYAAAASSIAKTPGNSNPLMDHKLGADPWALVYNGRVYVYMSSDAYEYNNDGSIKENGFSNLNKIHLISSADMVNWTDHGAIPVAGQNNANNGKGIAKWAGLSWAPAAAHKVIDGKDKFFLYFANGASGIGVLTADSPVGPWKDPNGKALVTGSTPGIAGVTWLFDPAVLIDDDGTGYLYCGGGIPNDKNQSSCANPKTARVIKLGADMISTVGSAQTIDAPFMFEDSGIHKYNNKYYYSYCINFSGTHPSDKPAGEIGYMVSNSPMGPFTYTGHFLKNPGTFFGTGGNNHHTVFKFKDQWYVVYHTQTVAKALLGSGKGYRSPHINKLEYDANGLIKEVQGDMKGIAQIENLNPYKRTEAETIGWNAGILTEECQASGGPVNNLDVTSINNGDWVAVGNADFGDGGAKLFKANVASTVGGKIEVRLDKADGDLVGTLDVNPTGGAQSWKLLETNVSNVTGVHRVYFVFTGTGTGNLFNVDYWQFTPKNTQTTPISALSKIEAESYDSQSGIETETCSEGGDDIGFIENGDYTVYSNIDFGSGVTGFETRVASATEGGNIEIRLDSAAGTLIGTCQVAATGDWQTWVDAKCKVSGVSGKHDLYLKFTGGEGYLFNQNWFRFVNDAAPVLMGDLNGDNSVNAFDYAALKMHLLGTKTLSEDALKLADLNQDKKVDARDFLVLKQYLLGKIDKLPTVE
ncbi:MAG TPA: carbohydrate-binding protein [Ruminiclostridium sp.]|nr:carbohydrate-binding protein [Ruminiclostridium sp.]